jgi:hypothetical protein
MLDILSAFLFGFISMWFALKLEFTKPECPVKTSLVDIANNYSDNKKICRELKQYSMNQIKHGNYEYIEVFETLKRQNNDKRRA